MNEFTDSSEEATEVCSEMFTFKEVNLLNVDNLTSVLRLTTISVAPGLEQLASAVRIGGHNNELFHLKYL
jgi:hypothetical protein